MLTFRVWESREKSPVSLLKVKAEGSFGNLGIYASSSVLLLKKVIHLYVTCLCTFYLISQIRVYLKMRLISFMSACWGGTVGCQLPG